MKKWRILAPIILSAALCVLSCCGAPKVQAAPYLTDLERIFTLNDQVSQDYVRALSAALAYTSEPSPETLAEAKEVCISSIDTITNAASVESDLTDEQRQAMGELGMDQADYMTPFIMEDYYRGTYLQALADTLRYLNEAPLLDDVLELMASLNISFEGLRWQIDLIGVNHLLAEVPEAELREFKDVFLPSLSSFEGAAVSWGSDRAALDAQSEEIFDQMEALVGEKSERLGAMYRSTLEEAWTPGEELEAAGLSPEEAARLEEGMEHFLEEGQQIGE